MRPGNCDHPEGLSQSATLGQLYVDAVHLAYQRRDIDSGKTALVRDDGNVGLRTDGGQSVVVVRRDRLFQDCDSELLQDWEHSYSAFDGPAAVRIDPDFLICRIPYGLEDFAVLIGSQFDLQYRVFLSLEHLGFDALWRVQPDGES